jgi:hypothetical protein
MVVPFAIGKTFGFADAAPSQDSLGAQAVKIAFFACRIAWDFGRI